MKRGKKKKEYIEFYLMINVNGNSFVIINFNVYCVFLKFFWSILSWLLIRMKRGGKIVCMCFNKNYFW